MADMFSYVFQAFVLIIQPMNLLVMMGGIVFGVVLGALPGISATMAVILAITFTYVMDPVFAITFLCALHCAAVTGGCISAILFSIPGTPASAVTVFDGGPMTERGEPGRALSIALISSAIGNFIGAVIMFFATAPLMIAALQFGASEMAMVVLLGLSILVFLDEKHMMLTLISGFIGLWIATIGQDPVTGQARFAFGSPFLLAGVDNLPFMIGTFALTELFLELYKPNKTAADPEEPRKLTKLVSLKEMWRMRWILLRESVLGTIVGILPGAGATIASFLAYTTEVKLSKYPEKFGTGIPDGIAASESANNAAAVGMMVPLLSMGITGGAAAAMMMVALSIQGVQAGPLLLKSQPMYLYAVVAGIAFASVAMTIVCFAVAKGFARVLAIPYRYLGALIFVLAVVGCYAKNGRISDIYIMIAAGVLGFYMNKYHFNKSALILGMVLGLLFEKNLRRSFSLAQTDGMLAFLWERPITIFLILVVAVIYGWAFVKAKRNRRAAA